MADNIPESAEGIAFLLFQRVSSAEGKTPSAAGTPQGLDRSYILDTYAACLRAVRQPEKRVGDKGVSL